MKKLVIVLCIALSIPLIGTHVEALRGIPFASESLTVTAAKTTITADLCGTGNRQLALLEVRTNSIFYVLHDASVTPTAADHAATAGDILELEHPNKWAAIRDGGSDATVKVTCFALP